MGACGADAAVAGSRVTERNRTTLSRADASDLCCFFASPSILVGVRGAGGRYLGLVVKATGWFTYGVKTNGGRADRKTTAGSSDAGADAAVVSAISSAGEGTRGKSASGLVGALSPPLE